MSIILNVGDEEAFMKYTEKFVFEMQRIWRSKEGLQMHAVIDLCARLEDVIYGDALREYSLSSNANVWQKKECIIFYQELCEKVKRNLDSRNDLNWRKVFDDYEKNPRALVNLLQRDDGGGIEKKFRATGSTAGGAGSRRNSGIPKAPKIKAHSLSGNVAINKQKTKSAGSALSVTSISQPQAQSLYTLASGGISGRSGVADSSLYSSSMTEIDLSLSSPQQGSLLTPLVTTNSNQGGVVPFGFSPLASSGLPASADGAGGVASRSGAGTVAGNEISGGFFGSSSSGALISGMTEEDRMDAEPLPEELMNDGSLDFGFDFDEGNAVDMVDSSDLNVEAWMVAAANEPDPDPDSAGPRKS